MELNEINERAEIETMKVIHDIKNPLFAICQIIDDPDVELSVIRDSIRSESEDIKEMLENLKIEFK